MNILIVVAHLRSGGPVEVVYNLCRGLKATTDIEVSVLSLRQEKEKSRIKDFRDAGIEVLEFGLTYRYCELKSKHVGQMVQKLVDERHFDIVHCHGYHPVIACALLKRTKLMTTLHNRANEDFINSFGPILGRYMLYRYINRLAHYHANVAVSASGADLYSKQVPNTRYVNNGIDPSRFCVSTGIEQLRSTLHLPLDRRIFVTSGRVEREKRCEELVTSFLNHIANHPIALLVLGQGSRLASCKEIAKDCPNIIFTGNVSNVAQYLQASDYYISYSKSEGMSMAVCEGVACGLYPVLSDIPSHHDVGEGVGGVFFSSPNDLNIDKLLNTNIDKTSLHQYICNDFSIPSMVKGYIDVYQSLV